MYNHLKEIEYFNTFRLKEKKLKNKFKILKEILIIKLINLKSIHKKKKKKQIAQK